MLLGFTRRPSIESGLGTPLAGIRLFRECLFLGPRRLHTVNRFRENSLVLELITLGEHVERVVNVLVNFLGVAHLLEETTENATAAHPNDLEGETGIGRTATLTRAFK